MPSRRRAQFAFEAANRRMQADGWARQVTVTELPIAKSLAASTCG
jgi:hypothetical protein